MPQFIAFILFITIITIILTYLEKLFRQIVAYFNAISWLTVTNTGLFLIIVFILYLINTLYRYYIAFSDYSRDTNKIITKYQDQIAEINGDAG